MSGRCGEGPVGEGPAGSWWALPGRPLPEHLNKCIRNATKYEKVNFSASQCG
jgi:hypothetical protein